MTEPALLVLEDGTQFHGTSVGAAGQTVGEVVFNTAMTGYQEILTDPSYFRQIVTLTYPHIGNVGTNVPDFESPRIFAAGLVIRDLSAIVSSWRAETGLAEFLQRGDAVAIADIDTRKLTRIIREKGAQAGCIVAGEDPSAEEALAAARAFPGLEGMDLARDVSTAEPYPWEEGTIWPDRDGASDPGAAGPRASGWREGAQGADSRTDGDPGMADFHVVAFDFGIKRNILRLLTDQGCRVTVVPAMTKASDVMALAPDGVFLSNGPGDPEPCDYAIDAIRTLLDVSVPIFGICLGHQLLALASGAQTEKMKFGHHGANHPVVDIDTGRVLITSQNHGFAVAEASLPGNVRPTHRSLFDGTLQGIERRDRPAFSFQGHPEASPGPHDVSELFERFVDSMCANRASAEAVAK